MPEIERIGELPDQHEWRDFQDPRDDAPAAFAAADEQRSPKAGDQGERARKRQMPIETHDGSGDREEAEDREAFIDRGVTSEAARGASRRARR